MVKEGKRLGDWWKGCDGWKSKEQMINLRATVGTGKKYIEG